MTETPEQPDKRDVPEDEQDVEGHSMLMYEQARTVQRERERDIEKHAREARMLEERKRQKR
jgi:hypothetical protein